MQSKPASVIFFLVVSVCVNLIAFTLYFQGDKRCHNKLVGMEQQLGTCNKEVNRLGKATAPVPPLAKTQTVQQQSVTIKKDDAHTAGVPDKYLATVTHIVMPFVSRQMDSLRNNVVKMWSCQKTAPCNPDEHPIRVKPEVVFYLGTDDEVNTVRADVTQMIQDIPARVKQCFSGFRLMSANLTAAENDYLSGTRLMWERLMSAGPAMGAHYVFYMEPDAIPIRNHWVQGLQDVIPQHEEFYAKGSIFRGEASLLASSTYFPHMFHINGNALYNFKTGFAGFYFNHIRPFVAAHITDPGYDSQVFGYIHHTGNWATTRTVIHKFIYSEFIQNMWHSAYNVEEMAQNYPLTYFAHGGTPGNIPTC